MSWPNVLVNSLIGSIDLYILAGIQFSYDTYLNFTFNPINLVGNDILACILVDMQPPLGVAAVGSLTLGSSSQIAFALLFFSVLCVHLFL